MTVQRTLRIAVGSGAIIAVACAPGCGSESTPQAPPPAAAPAPNEREDGQWTAAEGSRFVAVLEDDPAVAAAIAEARAAADAARLRWNGQNADARARWAIKWAAPTNDGGVEYVWVRPTSWSRYRIEGRLASPPRRELLPGATVGDLVGFAAQDLADWLDESGDVPQGGFTTHVLDARYGPAPP
jgi:uncharacterized protein YegJ (DUF2314 family)